MADNFLDKFRSGMKAVQGRQLLVLLSREKERGSISNLEEFKSRLVELTNQLSGTTIKPTLELYLAKVGDRIDSETYDFMIERIEDDLKAAFLEANTIDEVLNSHETIVNDVVLKNLELAINDLESQIESFEFLNKTAEGFDNAIFNTFRITQNARNAFNEGVIFLDPKTGLQSLPVNEASIDFIGEKLLLKSELNEQVRINTVRQIFDHECKASELPVQLKGSNINNIIDDRVGTFWMQSVLLSKPQGETGVLTKLELDLGVVKTINYLELEPILYAPVELYNISFLDSNNQLKTILYTPVEINSTNKLFFTNISTSKLILTFRNKNFNQTQFELKADSPVVTILEQPLNSDALIESIRPELEEVVSSPRIKELFGLDEETQKTYRKYYEYFIGFDSIKVGLNRFEENSIFVSKTEKIKKLGQVGLRVNEKRPFSYYIDSEVQYTTDTQPSHDFNYFHGSIEYYLIKRDFTADGTLLNSMVTPLLPVNTSKIRHERLILSKKSSTTSVTNDIGELQFYTDEAITSISVYRNGVIMTPTDLSTINPSELDGWLIDSSTVRDPKQPSRMKIAIKIQAPVANAIYTVSYVPAISTSVVPPQDLSSAALIVDTAGLLDAWIANKNIVYFSDKKNSTEIDYSLINLAIILRRNSSNVRLTPVVEDYLLATSSIDRRKFGDT